MTTPASRSNTVFNGWPLTRVLLAALLLMTGLAFWPERSPVEAWRMVIRATAHTSLVLFLLAFTASSAARLAPSNATRWLRRNRRYLGVSFAASHGIHAAAFIMVARLDPALFDELTNPVTFIGGGLAYLFIALMTATSLDRSAAFIGPRLWQWLHTAGAWYLWLSFALNFGKRAGMGSHYLLATLLILLALGVRLAAMRRTGQAQQLHRI